MMKNSLLSNCMSTKQGEKAVLFLNSVRTIVAMKGKTSFGQEGKKTVSRKKKPITPPHVSSGSHNYITELD